MMDDLQTGPSDPKPVFEGDWNSATGVEKGQHSERVRQWKLRNGLSVGGRIAAGSRQPVSRLRPAASAAPPDAAAPDDSRRVLEEIRDDHRALHSDRIRAAQQLIALDRGEQAGAEQASDLVTLRAVLETLRPEERLAWLQGERLEAATGVAP